MSDLTWRDTPLIDLAFYINGVAFINSLTKSSTIEL